MAWYVTTKSSQFNVVTFWLCALGRCSVCYRGCGWWLAQEILSFPSVGPSLEQTTPKHPSHSFPGLHARARQPVMVFWYGPRIYRARTTDQLLCKTSSLEHNRALLRRLSHDIQVFEHEYKLSQHLPSVILNSINALPGPNGYHYLGLLPLCSWNGKPLECIAC